MVGIPLVEFGSDHRQVDRPLYDLVVMTSLHEKAITFKTFLDQNHAATLVQDKSFKCAT